VQPEFGAIWSGVCARVTGRAPVSPRAARAEALASSLPGNVGFERELSPAGERWIWLESAMVQRLKAMRGPGETYRDVILKLIEIEAAR